MKSALAAALTAVMILLSSCAAKDGLIGRWRAKFHSEEAGGSVELIYEFREDGLLYICTDGDNGFSLPFGTFETDGDELVIRTDTGAEKYLYSADGGALVLRQNGRETSFEKVKE